MKDSLNHRDLGTSVFVSFPEVYFVLIMYCTLSHMVGLVTSSANDQLYTIKINKDFLMRLLKRGGICIESMIKMHRRYLYMAYFFFQKRAGMS